MIAIGNALDLNVIAEGIETPEQYHFLLERGCDNGQGYLFSRPVPHEQISELLQKGSVAISAIQPISPNSTTL